MAVYDFTRETDYSQLVPFLVAADYDYAHQFSRSLWNGYRRIDVDPLMLPRAVAREQIEICKRRKEIQDRERWLAPVPTRFSTERILDGIDLEAEMARAVAEEKAPKEFSALVDGERFAELQKRRGKLVEVEKAMILGHAARVQIGRPKAEPILLGAMAELFK